MGTPILEGDRIELLKKPGRLLENIRRFQVGRISSPSETSSNQKVPSGLQVPDPIPTVPRFRRIVRAGPPDFVQPKDVFNSPSARISTDGTRLSPDRQGSAAQPEPSANNSIARPPGDGAWLSAARPGLGSGVAATASEIVVQNPLSSQRMFSTPRAPESPPMAPGFHRIGRVAQPSQSPPPTIQSPAPLATAPGFQQPGLDWVPASQRLLPR